MARTRAQPQPEQPLDEGGTADPAAVAAGPLAAVDPTTGGVAVVNDVRLVGRVSAAPEVRELPSGDLLVQLRVVIPRPPRRRSPTARTGSDEAEAAARPSRAQVDTIDVTCWSAAARRSAQRLQPDDVVEVQGALRRRFFRAGASTQSRYEVEASRLRRVGRRATGPRAR